MQLRGSFVRSPSERFPVFGRIISGRSGCIVQQKECFNCSLVQSLYGQDWWENEGGSDGYDQEKLIWWSNYRSINAIRRNRVKGLITKKDLFLSPESVQGLIGEIAGLNMSNSGLVREHPISVVLLLTIVVPMIEFQWNDWCSLSKVNHIMITLMSD